MKITIPLSKTMANGSFAIANAGRKSYVTPGWVEVPYGTQISDIVVELPKQIATKHIKTEHFVKGSSNSVYTVIIDSKLGNSCTCVGFQYHRNCKHIKNILNIK